MNRNYLIAGLGIGLVLGLNVTVGVVWFFKQRQPARRGAVQTAVQAAVAGATAKEEADKFTATVEVPKKSALWVAKSPSGLEMIDCRGFAINTTGLCWPLSGSF